MSVNSLLDDLLACVRLLSEEYDTEQASLQNLNADLLHEVHELREENATMRALLETAAAGFPDDWEVSEFTAKVRAYLAQHKKASDE